MKASYKPTYVTPIQNRISAKIQGTPYLFIDKAPASHSDPAAAPGWHLLDAAAPEAQPPAPAAGTGSLSRFKWKYSV